jgi:hypothetical protein
MNTPQNTPTDGSSPTPKVSVRPIIRRQKTEGATPQIIRRGDSNTPDIASPSPRGMRGMDETQQRSIAAIRKMQPTTGTSPIPPTAIPEKKNVIRKEKKPHDVIPLDNGEQEISPTESRFTQRRKSLGRETTSIDLTGSLEIPTPATPNNSPAVEEGVVHPLAQKTPSLRVMKRKSVSNLKDVSFTPPTPEPIPEPTRKMKMREKSDLIIGNVKIASSKRPGTGTPTTTFQRTDSDIFPVSPDNSESEDITDEGSIVDDETSFDEKPHDEKIEKFVSSLTPAMQRLVDNNSQRRTVSGPITTPLTRKESGNLSARVRRVSEANLVTENPLKYVPEEIDNLSSELTDSEILENYGIRLVRKGEDAKIEENIINVNIDEPEDSENLVDFIHNIKASSDKSISFRHFGRNPLYNPLRARDISLESCFTLEDAVRYNEVVLAIIDTGMDPNNHVIFKQEWDNAQNDKLTAQQRSAVLARKTTQSRRYSQAVAAVLQRTVSLPPAAPEKPLLKVEKQDHHSLATCSPNWKMQLKGRRYDYGFNMNMKCVYQPEWQMQLQRSRTYSHAISLTH